MKLGRTWAALAAVAVVGTAAAPAVAATASGVKVTATSSVSMTETVEGRDMTWRKVMRKPTCKAKGFDAIFKVSFEATIPAKRTGTYHAAVTRPSVRYVDTAALVCVS